MSGNYREPESLEAQIIVYGAIIILALTPFIAVAALIVALTR